MQQDVILTKGAYPPIVPYCQAIRADGFLFISGQSRLDPETQQLTLGGITAQTRSVLYNIAAILRAAGSDLHKVVRSTIYQNAWWISAP